MAITGDGGHDAFCTQRMQLNLDSPMLQLMVYDVKRSAKTEKRVKERTGECKCLWFDEETGEICNEKAVSNGQCRHHINQDNAELRKLPSKAARARYLAEEIRVGRRLANGEQRKFRRMAKTPAVRRAAQVSAEVA